MALSILDGNQSATTLSTIVTSGQHIPAHTVVSIGTQAITDISGAISGSTVCVGNLGLLQSTVATEGLTASGSFIKIGGHTGTSTTGNIVHVSAIGALRVDGSVYTQPISIASVTIGNTVTIAGTVTANPTGTQTIAGSVTLGAGTAQIGSVTASISGTVPISISSVTIGNSVTIGSISAEVVVTSVNAVLDGSGFIFGKDRDFPVSGSVTIGAGTAQIGSVTASISNSVTIASFATSVTARLINPAGTAVTYAEVGAAGNPSIDVLSVQGVSGGTSLLIGGTTGSFTTRFGSVTTANTAQISTAVTNLSRKYLFVQNVTTSSNVITLGIGFTPTTTQGIQLAAGALIDFESSFIPTGAVYILSSVTGSTFTILEA